MRFLSKTLKENTSNLLYLTIAAVLAIAFLWPVVVAKESKHAQKPEQIVTSEQKTEVESLQK